jgi:hypothetical protein
VTDHDVDDEERRGCQKCECDQGPADTIIVHHASRAEYRKARRTMEQAHAAAVAAMAGEAGTDETEEHCNQCGRRREPWQSKDDARCPMHAVPEPYSSCDGTLVCAAEDEE